MDGQTDGRTDRRKSRHRERDRETEREGGMHNCRKSTRHYIFSLFVPFPLSCFILISATGENDMYNNKYTVYRLPRGNTDYSSGTWLYVGCKI